MAHASLGRAAAAARSPASAFRFVQQLLLQAPLHQQHARQSSFMVGVSRVYKFEQLPLGDPPLSSEGQAENPENLPSSLLSRAAPVHILTSDDVERGAASALINSLDARSGAYMDLIIPLQAASSFTGSAQSPSPPKQLSSISAERNAGIDGQTMAEVESASNVSVSGLQLNTALAAPMSSLVSSLSSSLASSSSSTRPHTSQDTTPPVLPGEGSFLYDDNEGASAGATAFPAGAASSGMPPELQHAFRCAEAGDVHALCGVLDSMTPQEASAAAQQAHPRHGGSLLHVLAASAAALEKADFQSGLDALVACGVNVNALAANGSTPLHWAAGAGHLGAVQALLAAGADACAVTYVWRRQLFGKGSGQTPMHWAAESGHTDVIEELLKGGGATVGGAVSGWRGGSSDLVGAFSASPHVAAALIPDERGVTAGELASKSGYKAAGDAIAQVTQQQYVRLRVSLQGQHIATSTGGS